MKIKIRKVNKDGSGEYVSKANWHGGVSRDYEILSLADKRFPIITALSR